MNGGRPLGLRKTVQLMVILTILAWATQTLLSQWGYGATPAEAKVTQGATSSFVPPADNGGSVKGSHATLEVRGEATVIGGDVKLKQICRWNAKDNAQFAPIADLVLVRLGADAPYRTLTVQELKQILHDAGVSLSGINFSGAVSCTVDRTDVALDEGKALQKWMAARENPGRSNPAVNVQDAPAKPQEVPALFPAEEAPAAVAAEEPVRAAEGPFHTLRDILAEDLAQRLGLETAQLQLQFNLRDDKILNLAEPQFRFNVVPQRARALGPVIWQVEVVTDTGVQRVEVADMAKAWQDQIVLTRPISAKQLIREEDVTSKRTLVDKLDDQPLLAQHQVVGNQAARDMKPGTVFTAKMVEPVPLARTGQFVTVTLSTANVKVKTVARAMESGSYGQTIKVKNEATKEVYEVILTGPQTAEMNGGAMQGGDKINTKDAKVASATE